MTGGDFWSKRQAAVQAEAAAAKQAEVDETERAEQAALAEKDDAEILADLDLPDPDTLELGDDVSGFMAKMVPDRLRRRALRRLWRLNPVLANVDGLVDYGEDFTDSATVIENLQTAYQVGKGMLAHVQELARQAELETIKDTLGEDPDPPADTDAQEPDKERPENVLRAEPLTPADPSESTPIVAYAPRRMRFEFDA